MKIVEADTRSETGWLADQLERAFRGGAWHGPALEQALAEVDAEAAVERPLAPAHTIAEIALHSRTWMDLARRRIEGEEVGEVGPEVDWPAAEELPEEAWRTALGSLEEAHRRLHAAVLALEDERLDDPVGGSDPTVRGLLFGVVQHNVYHAGQIVLLRKAVAARKEGA